MSCEKSFELTAWEKLLANSCCSGDFIVMSSAFLESETKKITLKKDLVKKALVFLQNRHPFLNAYLEIHRPENKMFLKIPNQNVSDKIELEWLDLTENITRSKLIEESARFNSILFKTSKENLLWRVQVISYPTNKYILNLALHLVITDGFNISSLTIELVNILNCLLENKECEEMKVKLEPIEDSHFLCKNRGDIFKEEHLKTIKDLNSKQKPKFILAEKFGTPKESGFNLDMFSLERELSKNIEIKCKSKQIRLSGYFHTIFLHALKKLYEENNLEFPNRVNIEIAASLRIRYKPKLDYSNCRPQITLSLFPTEEKSLENFWQDAFYVHNLIQTNTSTQTGSLFSLSHKEDLDEFNKVFARTKTNEEAWSVLSEEVICDLLVSNLGRYVYDEKKVIGDSLRIDELYCSDSLTSYPRISPAIVVHLVYWNEKIMVQMGANKAYLASCYFYRYKQLILDTISSSLIKD